MAKFVLDTDTCIYWLKGDRNIEGRIIETGIEKVFISVITECELYYGAFKSQRVEKNFAVLKGLRNNFRTLHTAAETAYIYGKIKAELESKGRMLDDADLMIASIAIGNDAVLVTNNMAHFRRIGSLKIENWK